MRFTFQNSELSKLAVVDHFLALYLRLWRVDVGAHQLVHVVSDVSDGGRVDSYGEREEVGGSGGRDVAGGVQCCQ